MWNYYAQSREGVNIVFNHSWNIFAGSNSSEVNSSDELENSIAIHRGLVIYKNKDKKKCIIELLNRLQEVYNKAKDDIKNTKVIYYFVFKEAVNNMSCFFKNEYFECENEYRIVLRFRRITVTKECLGDIVEKGNLNVVIY